MISETRNIFQEIPDDLSEELFQNLAESENVRIERIVSNGQATPEGTWYDQSWCEWVILLSGSAGLRIEGEVRVRKLLPGDHFMIPAGCRHRVEWTEPARQTIWLAVHILNPAQKEEMTE